MVTKVEYLIKFPKESPTATAGVFFPEKGILITGHENGVVILWTLSGGEPNKLYECSSKIETISRSPASELVIGSHGGDIVVLTLDGNAIVLQKASYSVNSRVWRSAWLNENAFAVTSTYGEIKVFTRSASGEWNLKRMPGHSDSVFGIGTSPNGLVATGDYYGNILVRTPKGDEYEYTQKIKIQNTVEDVAWFKDDVFAAINQSGKIYLFERTIGEGQEWKSVYEIKDATSRGTSVNITEDGKTIFAGTSTEVIQFDEDTLQADKIGIAGVKKIFSIHNDIFILTSYGFLRFQRIPVEVKPDLIKYKYVKIGLVGHTQVGKSTLCEIVTTGKVSELSTTSGKKIWNWELPKDNGLEKRVMLHDHGGQETVLSTFLPFLVDSDIILILWDQTDVTTLRKAIQILQKLAPKIADTTKVFFVQTHIDQPIDEFDIRIVDALIRKGRIIGNLRVAPKYGTGIEELKASILKAISWEHSRLIVQTASANGVLKTIMALQEKNATVISIEQFIEQCEKETNLRIGKTHLKFLLGDYSNQDMLEFNDDLLPDLIIFNDKVYNKLKTDIPIFVMKNDGIVSFDSLKKEFSNNRYLDVLDAMYLKYGVAIENFEQRIFPELLLEEAIEIPQETNFHNYLKDKTTITRFFSEQDIDLERLIAALSEIKLRCAKASKLSGLFSWEENAVIYYSFEKGGNAFDGFFVRCDYRIGGKKQQICDRLNQEFTGIIERLFGPFIELTKTDDKKKVDVGKKNVIYDVAISYASEQIEYAQKVADILRAQGVRVFFDRFFETKMWGKELASYLEKVYRDESQYCMIFISKEYVSKAWPTHELRSAITRSIESMGEYILPIRFDDSEVPGLTKTVKYLKSSEKTPEQIAEMFMEKLKD